MLLHNLTRSCTHIYTTERLRWCNLSQQQQLSLSRHWHDSKNKRPSTAVLSLALSLLWCVAKGNKAVKKNKTRQNFVGNGLIYNHISFFVLFTSWNLNSYNYAVVSQTMKVIVFTSILINIHLPERESKPPRGYLRQNRGEQKSPWQVQVLKIHLEITLFIVIWGGLVRTIWSKYHSNHP